MLNTKTVVGLQITLLQLIAFASTSWIYPAPRALFGAAAASASSAPLSHIADYRRKSSKIGQLQEEKEAEQEMPLPESEGSEGDLANEASPSLFQKKVTKILTKLRLIAQIKHAYNYKPQDEEGSSETSAEVNSTVPALTNSTTSSINITFEEPAVNEKGPPVEADVDIVQTNTSKTSPKGVKSEKLQEPSRLGSLGIFFAELVGSLVGLAYGAAAQFGAGGQSPVTISTSEGL